MLYSLLRKQMMVADNPNRKRSKAASVLTAEGEEIEHIIINKVKEIGEFMIDNNVLHC
jgi:hypothetical protein